MSDSITGLSSTNYSDVYDSKAGSLTNKLTGTDYSKASDDELMSVCKDFESYFVEQVLKSMEKMAKIDSDDEDSNLFSSMAGIGGTRILHLILWEVTLEMRWCILCQAYD